MQQFAAINQPPTLNLTQLATNIPLPPTEIALANKRQHYVNRCLEMFSFLRFSLSPLLFLIWRVTKTFFCFWFWQRPTHFPPIKMGKKKNKNLLPHIHAAKQQLSIRKKVPNKKWMLSNEWKTTEVQTKPKSAIKICHKRNKISEINCDLVASLSPAFSPSLSSAFSPSLSPQNSGKKGSEWRRYILVT